jgi:glycosyltransferase involved in cell wall biosynthesis
MNVLFLHLENAPITFYRMIQFSDELKNLGFDTITPALDFEKIDVEMRPFESNPGQYISELNKLFEIADIVVTHAAHNLEFMCTLEALKQTHKKPMILELDDNPFEIDENHYAFKNIGIGSQNERNVFDMLNFCDAVICSTEYLKDTVQLYNHNAYVIPNAINFNIWDNLTKTKNDKQLTIGWAGANGHKKDLKLISEVLIRILERNKHVIVKTLHGAKDLIKHERFINDNTWTNILKYPQKFADMGFDIGLAPLWDNEFNRCKSNLRYLEMSALKIPVIASNVEPYKKSITDGVDGLIAKSKKDFIDKIQFLIDNEDERYIIGYTAYQNIKDNWNLKTVTQKYADILKEIYNKVKSGCQHS